MVRRVYCYLRRVFRALAANHGTFAGGAALSDPLGLLAVERERVAARYRIECEAREHTDLSSQPPEPS
jgi:hypothetical protein